MLFWQIPSLDGRSALGNGEGDKEQETEHTGTDIHSHPSQEMPDLGTQALRCQAPQEICDP